MSSEGFMQTEREQLQQRREGKLRRALGLPLPGESTEQLDRIGELDRLRAEQALVSVKRGDRITHKHLDNLTMVDMHSRNEAEWETVRWLEERVECAKRGESAPPVPKYLLG